MRLVANCYIPFTFTLYVIKTRSHNISVTDQSSVVRLLELLVDQLERDASVGRRGVLEQARTVGGRRLEQHLERQPAAALRRRLHLCTFTTTTTTSSNII